MEALKKKSALKTVIIVAAAVIILGLAIGGFFIVRHNRLYISKNEAYDIAVKDAATDAMIKEHDVDFEKVNGSAYYEVEFETLTTEYEYIIDAKSGEILSKSSKAD